MFERFSEQAKRVLALARQEAAELGHGHVGTEHLLLGILAEGSSTAARVLTTAGATLAGCRDKAVEAVGTRTGKPTGGELPFSDRAARSLERAGRLSLRRRAPAVETEHILQSVLDVEGTAGQVLRGLSVDVVAVRAGLEVALLAAGHEGRAGDQAARTTARAEGAETTTSAGAGDVTPTAPAGIGHGVTTAPPGGGSSPGSSTATARPGGSTPPDAGDLSPHCAVCGSALDATLSHRRVRSHAVGGTTEDLMVSYCSGCGSSLGAWPASRGDARGAVQDGVPAPPRPDETPGT